MIWSPLRWSRPAWDLLFIIDIHVHRASPLPANSRVGLSPARGAEKSRHPHVVGTLACLARRRGIIAKCRRADFCTNCRDRPHADCRIFSSPNGWWKRTARPLRHVEPRRSRRRNSLRWRGIVCSSRRSRSRRKIRFSTSNFKVESLGALPLPPSIWHWDGLVNTPHGVYEVRLDLSEPASPADIEHRFYPDAFVQSIHRRRGALTRSAKGIVVFAFPGHCVFTRKATKPLWKSPTSDFQQFEQESPCVLHVPRENGRIRPSHFAGMGAGIDLVCRKRLFLSHATVLSSLSRRCVLLDRAVHTPHDLPGTVLLPLDDFQVPKLSAGGVAERRTRCEFDRSADKCVSLPGRGFPQVAPVP